MINLLTFFFLSLSHHSHDNGGPKFGIKLLSHDNCKTVKSLELDDMGASEDLLHIPTPWHNCVVQIKDYNCYYVTKSQVISKALQEGGYVGGWYKADRKGGHFNVARLAQENISNPVKATTLSTNVDVDSLQHQIE